MFGQKPKEPLPGWRLVSQLLLELTGVITPLLLAGVSWLVVTLPQQLRYQDTQIKRILDGQEELKQQVKVQDLQLRQHELRLTREELR